MKTKIASLIALSVSIFVSMQLLAQTNYSSQGIDKPIPYRSLGNFIAYKDMYLYNFSANKYTPNENDIDYYSKTWDDQNYNKTNEFTRKEYLLKMKKYFSDKINTVNYNKEFIETIDGRLSDYNFSEKCFNVTFSNDIDLIEKGNKVVNLNWSNQKIYFDNYNCFDFQRLYLNPDLAKGLVERIARHTSGARPICVIVYYSIVNRKTGNEFDLTAHINRISFYERELTDYNIYMPMVEGLYPHCENANNVANNKDLLNKAESDFMVLPSGLQYKIIKHGSGYRKPAPNDHIEIRLRVHVGDSILFDSYKTYGMKPVQYPIAAPKYKGDPMEGFMMMVAGDSAVIRLPVEVSQEAGNQLLPWMKSGDIIEYDIVMVSVRTEEEEKKVNDEKVAKQNQIDNKLLMEYFEKNDIHANMTKSGLYYLIKKEGTGDLIKTGQTVSVRYKGQLMNGTIFDSNMDMSFQHNDLFTLEIGIGKVIKGWDEGIQLLKNGSSATFYIPSSLAYGSLEMKKIPANSILIFDVDIVNTKPAGD